ncbi:MAG: YbaK/EbsC family protein [Betaproteobacteria bacterium]|nr:YbaK/EbsC family protein [Betaproteobacteria bacterium]
MPPDNPFTTSSGESTIQQHTAVARVREALGKAGVANSITVMPEATHTAQAAADALGCNIAEIAKSIIFRAQDGRAVLVITSGVNRVDDRKVAALIGQTLGKADADFVRAQCGFVIGGVAPVAHLAEPITLMDEDLLKFGAVWPAAGHPNTMFRISPQDLARISGARVADIAQRKST